MRCIDRGETEWASKEATYGCSLEARLCEEVRKSEVVAECKVSACVRVRRRGKRRVLRWADCLLVVPGPTRVGILNLDDARCLSRRGPGASFTFVESSVSVGSAWALPVTYMFAHGAAGPTRTE